jgi:hypothetical protein
MSILKKSGSLRKFVKIDSFGFYEFVEEPFFFKLDVLNFLINKNENFLILHY